MDPIVVADIPGVVLVPSGMPKYVAQAESDPTIQGVSCQAETFLEFSPGFRSRMRYVALSVIPKRQRTKFERAMADLGAVEVLSAPQLVNAGSLRFPNLRELWTSGNVSEIEAPNLSRLDLNGGATGTTLVTVGRFSRLRDFSIASSEDLESLAGIEGCPSVERLSLFMNRKLADVAPAAQLPLLTRLEFDRQNRILWDGLRGCSAKELMMSACGEVADVDWLTTLPRLEAISIRARSATAA